jgi:hypothetical protein
VPFRKMLTDEMRSVLRHQLETLERWLQRLIDDVVHAHYGGALSALPSDIQTQAVTRRRDREPQRYPREVDALLFSDLVIIICHQDRFCRSKEVTLHLPFRYHMHEFDSV